jgi:hypothetical protein
MVHFTYVIYVVITIHLFKFSHSLKRKDISMLQVKRYFKDIVEKIGYILFSAQDCIAFPLCTYI